MFEVRKWIQIDLGNMLKNSIIFLTQTWGEQFWPGLERTFICTKTDKEKEKVSKYEKNDNN